MHNYHFVLTNDDLQMMPVFRMITRAFPGSSIWLYSKPEDVLEHVLTQGADLVLTNDGSGDLTAIELIRDLRKRAGNIPIIIFSSTPGNGDRARRAGATEFILQSRGRKVLEACLRRSLPAKRGEQARAAY